MVNKKTIQTFFQIYDAGKRATKRQHFHHWQLKKSLKKYLNLGRKKPILIEQHTNSRVFFPLLLHQQPTSPLTIFTYPIMAEYTGAFSVINFLSEASKIKKLNAPNN